MAIDVNKKKLIKIEQQKHKSNTIHSLKSISKTHKQARIRLNTMGQYNFFSFVNQ